MAHPAIIAADWVADRLAPAGVVDATLAAAGVAGVWPDRVPPSAAWGTDLSPHYHVIYAEQAPGGDQYLIGQRRLTTDPLLQVAVVGRVADVRQLAAAAERIDALLHEASGATTGGEVLACTRERPLKLGPMNGPGVVTTYKLGGLYRLVIREEA